MGETIRLEASDGHALSAYRAQAKGVRKGGVVVVQEVFGVNSHIRSVCDRFADELVFVLLDDGILGPTIDSLQSPLFVDEILPRLGRLILPAPRP
jgi:carboxymethylenebutenolidase